jgi:hypothetical protein
MLLVDDGVPKRKHFKGTFRMSPYTVLMNFFVATALLIAAAANGADQKIKLQDMPASVQQAVTEKSRGAVVRGYSKELENGRTLYEVELTVNGHARDVSFDKAGKW